MRSPDKHDEEADMNSRILNSMIAVMLFVALALPLQLAAQHTRYKLIDLGTFGGPGSTPTEFQQILNNHGTVVGGADFLYLNPYPNCFNPFNAPDCYVQHAFVWRDDALTDLGTLPSGSSSFAYFITGNGLIVGGSENGLIDPVAGTPEAHAVLWRNAEIKDLGTLGGTSSGAFQANNRGQVIGIAQNAIADPFSIAGLGTQTRGFIWQDGMMHDLSTLGGPDSFAQIVNQRGQVAGVSYTSDNPDANTGLPPLDPFLWENGKMKDLGNFGGTNDFLGPFIFGLNNRGEVTGTMALVGDQIDHAFLWDGEKLSDLQTLGGNFSFATGLNDAGEVIGFATPPGDQVIHAFLWRKGTMKDLGTLGNDPCSTAESINSRGQVVGASQSGCDFFTRAFLWENGGPSVDLNTLVSPRSALQLTGAFWINDRGEIAGRGVPPGCGDVDICGHAFLLIPCDRDHNDAEECSEQDEEAIAATENSSAPVNQTATTAPQSPLSPSQIMAVLRTRMAHRYQIPGPVAPPRD
jgi:probable HAF family extracellular repeat protein